MERTALIVFKFVGLLCCIQLAFAQCTDKSTSCSQILGKPSLCYSAYNRDLCCKTCQTVITGPAGCEYGDKSSWCTTEPKPDYPTTCYYNEDLCCASCATYRDASAPANCKYGDKDPSCAAAVADNMAVCDVGTNSDICCKSCGSIPTGPAVSTIDSSMKHSIEIRVVVDKFAFDKWKATVSSTLTEAEKKTETGRRMDQYINAVFQGVNSIFGALVSAGISLDTRIVSVEYITTQTVAKESSPGFGNVDTMLDELKVWLSTNNYTKVDHTLLLTGLDVSDNAGNVNVLGAAKVGAMCSSDSVSVVEAVFNGNTVLTLAHELGHSLSCQHDGEGNGCSANLHYIMDASKEHNSTQNFRFSECSVDYIKTKLQSLYSVTGGNCLSAVNTKATPVTSGPLGKLYDPDEMCRRSVGAGSYVCRSMYGPSGTDYSSVCTAVWCALLDGSNQCTSVVAADGFTCGKDKECSLGFCKASSTTHTVKDTCALGDLPSYAKVKYSYDNSQRTCSQLVTSSYAGACYDPYYYSSCCDSCDKAKKTTVGCEYGDQSQWCKEPARVYPITCYLNEKLCCGTCAPLKNTSLPTGCEYGDKQTWCLDGTVKYPTTCYYNAAQCCKSCFVVKDTSLPAGCQYGDYSTGCVAASHCPLNADKACCATCAKAG